MRFEWDSRKAESNLRKHGISFDDATTVFEDPFAITLEDLTHSQQEDRLLTIGRIVEEDDVRIVLTVVHVNRYGTLRILSARKATARERDLY